MFKSEGRRRFQWGGMTLSRFTPSLVLLIFIPVLLCFLAATLFNSHTILQEVQTRYQIPSVQGRSEEMAKIMVIDLLLTDPASRILELGSKVALLKKDPSVDYVRVLGREGKIIYDSEGPTAAPGPADARGVLGRPRPFALETSRRGAYEYVVPLLRGRQEMGALVVGYSRKSLEGPFAEVKRRIWLTVGFMLAGISLLMLAMAWWLSRPVEEIVRDFMKVIRQQNLASRVRENGFGEIRLLQKAYNRLKNALEEMQTTRALLGKYVSPQVADMVLDGKLDVIPQKRRITLLTIDIEKFTDFTASHDAVTVTEMISRFWEIVEEAIHHAEGTVDKHVGDAVIGMWNAPLLQPDAPLRAVRCAFDIEQRIHLWNKDRAQTGLEKVQTWTSVATGSCVVGNLGRSRMEYTALGNTMNIVSRMISKAHELQVRKVIDRNTHDVVQADVEARDLGEHAMRGIGGPVRLFELISEKSSDGASPAARGAAESDAALAGRREVQRDLFWENY